MPEQWMYDGLGDEARPRPGFEDELARELQRTWRGQRAPWHAIAWGAAAAALLIGVVVVVAIDDSKKVAPADGSVPVTAESIAPSSTAAAPTSVETTVPATTNTTVVATISTIPQPTSGVGTYLSALATGDFLTAAQLLNEGSLSPEHRADTRPLFRPEFGLVPGQTDRDAVAAALEKWCSVALCVQPTEVADLADGWWTRAVFPAPGGALTGLFTDYELEGRSGVTGLPPLAPDTAETAPTVACPTESVRYVAWADLDGDGRPEQLVGRSVGDAGSPEDGVEDFVIDTCGTTLQVEPFELTGDGLAIYPANPTGLGADTLLIGFREGYPSGGVYRFDGQRLVQVDGPSGPATFAFAPFIAALPEAETFGCVVMTEGQPPVMANLEYRLVGGNDLSNSTSMELMTVDVITGASMSTTFDLPEHAEDASESLNGRCNGLPAQTG